MAEPQDSCILWTKFEDATSEIGPNGLVSGTPTYHGCKFNDGVKCDAVGEHIRFPAVPGYSVNQGLIEFWLKTDSYILTNAKPNSGLTHSLVVTDFISLSGHTTLYLSPTFGMVWDWHDGVGLDQWYTEGGGSAPSIALTMALNEVAHLMFVWDRAGIEGGLDTRRVYLNGIQIGNRTIARANSVASGFYIEAGNGGSNQTIFSKAIQDNLKIYNTLMTTSFLNAVISNKDTEGWPIISVGGIPLLNGGLRSPLLKSNMLN